MNTKKLQSVVVWVSKLAIKWLDFAEINSMKRLHDIFISQNVCLTLNSPKL